MTQHENRANWMWYRSSSGTLQVVQNSQSCQHCWRYSAEALTTSPAINKMSLLCFVIHLHILVCEHEQPYLNICSQNL